MGNFREPEKLPKRKMSGTSISSCPSDLVVLDFTYTTVVKVNFSTSKVDHGGVTHRHDTLNIGFSSLERPGLV